MNKILNKIHLAYLGIIPSVVTFFILQKTENSGVIWFLMFIFGTAIIGVYLAMIGSYRKDISNSWLALLVLLDGPIFGLLSALSNHDYLRVITNTFLIENIAIWISIAVLSVSSGVATRKQATASIVLSVVLLTSLFGLYYKIGFFHQPLSSYVFVAAGAIEALVINYKVLKEDNVERDSDDSAVYILIYIALWVASLFIGGAIANK